MKILRHIMMFTAAAIALVGCTTKEELPVDFNNAIVVSADIASATRANSEASGNLFVEGDLIAIANLSVNKNQGTIGLYEFIDQEWISAYHLYEGFAEYVYWLDKDNDFVAWAPYDFGYEWGYIRPDQSDLMGLRSADWMTASANDLDIPADNVLALSFEHELAKVVFNITSVDEAYLAQDVIREAVFSVASEIIPRKGKYIEKESKTVSGYAKDMSMTAILAPGKYAAGDALLNFVYGSDRFVLNVPETGLELASGNAYTFSLEIKKSDNGRVHISNIEVAPWTEQNLGEDNADLVSGELFPVTLGEFLAAPESSFKWYELTGVIESIANRTYGNLYLTDGVDTVYIYGITREHNGYNDQSFNGIGLYAGDTLTVATLRGSYEGIPEGGQGSGHAPAYYISHRTMHRDWALIGNFEGHEWDVDYPMTEVQPGVWMIDSVLFKYEDEFKLRADRNWDYNRGAMYDSWVYPWEVRELCHDGSNFIVGEEGMYTVTYYANASWYGKEIVEFIKTGGLPLYVDIKASIFSDGYCYAEYYPSNETPYYPTLVSQTEIDLMAESGQIAEPTLEAYVENLVASWLASGITVEDFLSYCITGGYNMEYMLEASDKYYFFAFTLNPNNGKVEGLSSIVVTSTDYVFKASEALEMIVNGQYDVDQRYRIQGIITEITEVSTSYGNATYYIADDSTATDKLMVFRGHYLNDEKFTSEDQIAVGDVVVIEGNLVNYKETTPEVTTSWIVSIDGISSEKPGEVEETMSIEVLGTTANNITVDVTYPEGTESFVLGWTRKNIWEYYYCTDGIVDPAKVASEETNRFNDLINNEKELSGWDLTLAQALNFYGYGNGYQTTYDVLAYDYNLWDDTEYVVYAYTAVVNADGELVITSNVANAVATTTRVEDVDITFDIEVVKEEVGDYGVDAFFKVTPSDLNQKYYFNAISGYDKNNAFKDMYYEDMILSIISQQFNFGGLENFLNYQCYTGVYDPTTAEIPITAYVDPEDSSSYEWCVFAAAISDKGEIVSAVTVYEYLYIDGDVELKDLYTIEIDAEATNAINVAINTTILDEEYAQAYYMVGAGLKSELDAMTDEEILAKDVTRILAQGYELGSYFEWYAQGYDNLEGYSLLNAEYYAEPGTEVVAYAYLADGKNGGRLLSKVARSESYTLPTVDPIDMTLEITFDRTENVWGDYWYAYFNIIPSNNNDYYFVGQLSKSEAEDLYAGLEGQELAAEWYKRCVGYTLAWGVESFVQYSCFTGPLYQATNENFWSPVQVNAENPDTYDWYYFAVAVDPETGHYASDFAIYEYSFDAPISFDIEVVETDGIWTATIIPNDPDVYYLPFNISDMILQSYYEEGTIAEPTVEAIASMYASMYAEMGESYGMTGRQLLEAMEAAQGVQEITANELYLGKNYFFAFTLTDDFQVEALTVYMFKELMEEIEEPGEYDIVFNAISCMANDYSMNGDGTEFELFFEAENGVVAIEILPAVPYQVEGTYSITEGNIITKYTTYVDSLDYGYAFESLEVEITSDGLVANGVLEDGRTIQIVYEGEIVLY